MAFEEFDKEDNAEENQEEFFSEDAYGDDAERKESLPEESNNRTFIIIAAIIGALIVVTIICMGIFAAIKIIPGMNAARLASAATSEAQATQQQELIQQSLTETAGAPTATLLFPPTFTPTKKSAATKTPLLAPSATPGEVGAATATVIALKTQLTAAQLTKLPTNTPSAVPTTGFADEIGAPALLGLAIVLVVIIFLARRLRAG